MTNGKIRHPNHIIDQKACRFLQDTFPSEWVQRTITPDYGLDIDLELFDYEEEKCTTLGEHVYLQVKGTEHAVYGSVAPFGRHFSDEAKKANALIPVLKFSLDVAELRLVERMGAAVPVMLVVVDLEKQTAYYICLNDYVKYVLPFQNPLFREQKTVTINIPTENELTHDTSDIILWYGKRAKLYSLFLEILAMVDNAKYLGIDDLLSMMKTRIEGLVDSDAWKAAKHWSLCGSIHNLVIEMHNNSLLNWAGKETLESLIPQDADPNQEIVEYRGKQVSAFVAAQLISCNHFFEQASTTACIFEDDIRHIGLPTTANWIMSS